MDESPSVEQASEQARWPLTEPDVQISRIRLSCEQTTGPTRRRQVAQTKVAKMRIKTATFGRTIRTLAAATQVNPQTVLHVIVEILKSSRRANTEADCTPNANRNFDFSTLFGARKE